MLHRPAICRLLIFVVTFVAFARLTTCEFTFWDDQDTIHQNRRLNPPTLDTLKFYWTSASERETMGLYVPVTYTFWSGLAKLARLEHANAQGIWLDARVFHTANVLLHALTAVVIFELLFQLFGNSTAAAMGALLFALHPVQVETVGWVSGTKDLLYALFSAGSLLFYLKAVQLKTQAERPRSYRRRSYLLGLFLFVLAMLSKPTGVVVPLMAGIISVLVLKQSIRRTITSLLPWFLLMIPCIIWTQKVQPPTGLPSLSIWTRPAVSADAIAFYLFKVVWPSQLGLDYGRNPMAIVSTHAIYFTWVLPALVAGVLFWKRKSAPVLVTGALLFLTPLLPVLGFVPFEFQALSTTADHYLYLPMFGFAMALAWLLNRPQPRAVYILVTTILIALTIRCIAQEPVWQDTRSLLNHALVVNPGSTASMGGLGYLTGREARALLDAGKSDQARPLFDESIEWYKKILAISPDSAPSMANLALDYQKIGRQDLGLIELHKIVAIEPTLPTSLRADPITVATLLLNFNDTPGAIAWLDHVLFENPANIPAAVLRQRAIDHINAGSK